MATYMPLISKFAERTAFWPPEAFTLDCRIEERIWEWCERVLKNNEEFMALVRGTEPLHMETTWTQIQGMAYGGLTECIFHYWLIDNYNQYKAGNAICQENADWICRKLNIKGPMPWTKPVAEPAPAPAPVADDPPPVRTDNEGGKNAGRFAAAGAGAVEQDCSVCMTSGDTMYVVKLSDVPKMTHAELRKWHSKLIMFCAECWSPDDCAAAERILATIDMNLRA
jgi:hypothetical protein